MVKFVCYALRFVADAEARMIAQESSDEDEHEDDTGSRDNDEDDISESDDNRPATHQSLEE